MNTETTKAANQDGIPFEPEKHSLPPGQTGKEAMMLTNFSYVDTKAACAVMGLPAGEVSQSVVCLEKQLDDWSVDHAEELSTMPLEPLRIVRLQVRELALGYSTEFSNKLALAIQADIGKAHIENQRKQAQFRSFMKEHFESDVADAEARNSTIFEMAQGIMLRAKPRWFEFWRR
jgi:hypothetical protein